MYCVFGLFFVRETHLLYDESVSFQRELVAQVIAHEQGNTLTLHEQVQYLK